MARVNRCDVLSPDEIQIVHCINRCVRRAFLCGVDPCSGHNYEHRRQWIRSRLEFLASVFGIEVLAYAIMSNHVHVVLRTRPDIVSSWSDEEVATRWCRLFPPRSAPVQSAHDTTIQAITADPSRLSQLRGRLSCVSWFMRCTAEVIARRANKEDECTGRFWDGRFRMRVVEDEAALIACMAYVDLNPIRAGETTTPEASRFTSVSDRIADVRDDRSGSPTRDSGPENGPRAGWLSPISTATPGNDGTGPRGRRVSDKGCLEMSLPDYLAFIDWTGRQLRAGVPTVIPECLPPILERLGITEDAWGPLVEAVARGPQRVVARPLTASVSRRNLRSCRTRTRPPDR